MDYTISESIENVNWQELVTVFELAPLGPRTEENISTVFSNSMFRCFLYDNDRLIGAARALYDGADCAVICDAVVLPQYQGKGCGSKMINFLLTKVKGCGKTILYTVPGKEDFYKKFGFRKMKTAMAVFSNQDRAKKYGLIE